MRLPSSELPGRHTEPSADGLTAPGRTSWTRTSRLAASKRARRHRSWPARQHRRRPPAAEPEYTQITQISVPRQTAPTDLDRRHNGGNALRSGRGPITRCEWRWQVAGFPTLDAIRCPDLRSASSADQPDLRGGDGLAGDPLARPAEVQRGRGGSWTSSLDRVAQVSEAIRCHGDIRTLQFWRLAAGMLYESRCRLPS